jgi:hypothetical protein
MLTENELNFDRDAANEVLASADVLTVGFTTFPERLLIDFRANEKDGPLATLVPPVATVQERYLWLGRHRGRFGAPQAFTFFVWPHTVRTLLEREILAPARARIDGTRAATQLDATLQELAALEREAFRAAVRGDEDAWKTIWQRAG